MGKPEYVTGGFHNFPQIIRTAGNFNYEWNRLGYWDVPVELQGKLHGTLVMVWCGSGPSYPQTMCKYVPEN